MDHNASVQAEAALERSHNIEKEMVDQLHTSMEKCKELEQFVENSPWKVSATVLYSF